ncbi:hypothetical protein [Halodurantibacterium flavum]|uniref:Uncharacterized protein n=1 Tax=Halodurantibacterium flavum TaxID=1382802 RepID=A0ABW4S1X9_9RHOB
MKSSLFRRLLGGIDRVMAELRRCRTLEELASTHATSDLLRRRMGLDA